MLGLKVGDELGSLDVMTVPIDMLENSTRVRGSSFDSFLLGAVISAVDMLISLSSMGNDISTVPIDMLI